MSKKPTHVYIARKPCGCCVGVITDLGDRFTAKSVAEFITDGLTVNRVALAEYRDVICKEAGFMECKHGQLALTTQIQARRSGRKPQEA